MMNKKDIIDIIESRIERAENENNDLIKGGMPKDSILIIGNERYIWALSECLGLIHLIDCGDNYNE